MGILFVQMYLDSVNLLLLLNAKMTVQKEVIVLKEIVTVNMDILVINVNSGFVMNLTVQIMEVVLVIMVVYVMKDEISMTVRMKFLLKDVPDVQVK